MYIYDTPIVDSVVKIGCEPETIKKRITTLFSKLDEAYPDKVIISLDNKHRKWAETALDISRKLGYASKNDFLTAYGYKIERASGSGSGGRPKSTDSESIIKEFQKIYPNGSPFTSVNELFAGTEYECKLKTIRNCANDTFGMSLSKYLLSIGLIQEKSSTKEKKKNKFIICKVLPSSIKNPVYCTTKSKTIHEGDNVEIPMGIHNNLVFASVQEVINCDEDSAPCNLDTVKPIIRKLGVREYTDGLLGSILRANAAIETDELISSSPTKPFSRINSLSVEVDGSIAWACCRGLASDVISVLDYLVKIDNQVYEYNNLILIEKGISELYIYGDDVLKVLLKFPEIKMAMFSENSQSGKVHLCYSKSGYSAITDTYFIGKCDTKSNSKWTLKNSPTENFKADNIEFTFKFSDDWESLNYVFKDASGTKKQLGK